MSEEHSSSFPPSIMPFNRHFFTGREKFTSIGRGQLGGKAQGLAHFKNIIENKLAPAFLPDIDITIPTLTVITTEFFDLFLKQNNLREMLHPALRDDQIATIFQKAELPAQLVGDLRSALPAFWKTPCSSLSPACMPPK
jgi:phosphoenolpyruvate synthase/pyruvate phosphate dikinase